jgi:5-hydroxyisourate hydrolase
MTRVTTHVLDTATGRPAAGLAVRLQRVDPGPPAEVAAGTTDEDGRVADWLPEGVPAGRYRLVFATGAWFAAAGRATLFPEIAVEFEIARDERRCHLPLLLAPFGYSTYRGS